MKAPREYWLGLIQYKLKHWGSAEKAFTAAVQRDPDHASSAFKLGLVLLKQQNWLGARRFIQRAIYLDPGKTNWVVQYRQVERHLSDEAPRNGLLTEREIRERLEKFPHSSFLHGELAAVLRRKKIYWQELESLRTALKHTDSDADLHFRLGVALDHMKRPVEAARHYARALELKPDIALWHYHLGYAYSQEGHDGAPDHAKSARHYAKAMELHKNKREQNLGIGLYHQKFERWIAAADAYETELRRSESVQLHARLGLCYLRLYAWDKAAAQFLQALNSEPADAKCAYQLGFARERQERFIEAAEAYSQAITHAQPHYEYWHYRLGIVLERVADFEGSCGAHLRARAVPQLLEDPDLERFVQTGLDASATAQQLAAHLSELLAYDATDETIWWELGKCHELLGEWAQAADAYTQAIKRSRKHIALWYYRAGYCLVQSGRFKEACRLFRNSRILQLPHGTSEAIFKTEPSYKAIAVYTEYLETLPIEDKIVLYESFHGKHMTCNPFALFVHLLERADFADWTHVWVVNDRAIIPQRFRALRNVIFVSRGSDSYLRYLASAKILINNVTFYTYFIRREEQVYVNTWHGTPWKMMGKDVRGEFMIFGNVTRNFLQATHIINPNRYTTDILLRKYNIEGLYRGVVSETGYPRIDLTLNATAPEKLALKARLGISDSRKVVLYAPTWRGTHGKPEIESGEVMREIELLKSMDCHVLFRGHALTGKRSQDLNVPEDITTNELLAIVDVLVTDYSSIFFDFIATGRPIVFYLKDYEQYLQDRGLYFGADELPGEVAYSLNELLQPVGRALSSGGGQAHPAYAEAARKFCPLEDGLACKRVVDLIVSDSNERARQTRKKSILVFGGGFLNSGITSSLLNLLNGIDTSEVDVALVIEPSPISADPARIRNLDRVPDSVRILPRSGATNTTLEERMIRSRVSKIYGLLNNPEVMACYKSLYAREFRRLFGSCYFDAVIDFEGYNVFWSSILSCAPSASAGRRTVYQHSDKVAEWKIKMPQLEGMFNTYRFYDRIISVSKMTMENNTAGLSGPFDQPVSKFDYVENMLNPSEILCRAGEELEAGEERSIFGSGGPVFVTVGRLSIEKDHFKLIRAFDRVRMTHPAARLLIVGDGMLMPDLIRTVEELKLTESVFLTGFRGNPFPYLAKSDCFVLSSNHEGQPMVLLEAMVLNKPIVSTDIVGARGVIEGRSGHLVDNSVEGLAGGMIDFLEGRVAVSPVDFDSYQRNSMEMFYRKSCGFSSF